MIFISEHQPVPKSDRFDCCFRRKTRASGIPAVTASKAHGPGVRTGLRGFRKQRLRKGIVCSGIAVFSFHSLIFLAGDLLPAFPGLRSAAPAPFVGSEGAPILSAAEPGGPLRPPCPVRSLPEVRTFLRADPALRLMHFPVGEVKFTANFQFAKLNGC